MEERIIQLFNKYINKTISQTEIAELKEFVSESEHNKEIFLVFLKLHKAEIQYHFTTQINKEESWERIIYRINHKRRYIPLWVASIAAILILGFFITYTYLPSKQQTEKPIAAIMQTEVQDRAIITLNNGNTIELNGKESSQLKEENIYFDNKNGSIVFGGQSKKPIYNKLQVMEGSTYKLTLCDGTKICLASGSELIFPVGGDKRNVKLRGEALFEVKHDATHPFTVDCENGTKVTVLGTKFNVCSRKQEPVTVTVESGKVGVFFNSKTIFLNGGEQATFDNHIESTVLKVDANLYTSWASGIYEFNDVPMKMIAHQLSLWYGVEFEFSNAELQERKFTGALLRNKNLGFTLGLLKEVSNIDFEMKDNKIIIK